MSDQPGQKLYKKLKKKQRDDDSVSTDNDSTSPHKSSVFSDLRNTLTQNVKIVKNKVSRSRGNFVRILTKNFQRRTRLQSETDRVQVAQPFEKTQPPLFPQLKESWEKVTPDWAAKDLHRLVFRTTVQTTQPKEILLEPPPLEERSGPEATAHRVADLIQVISKELLESEEAQTISDICAENLVNVDEKTDMIEFNTKVFKEIGEDSAIVGLLRCFHQSLVLKPYGILRTVMIPGKLTKDVRGDEGWQVEVTFVAGKSIQVRHLRKEQSLDLPTKNQPVAAKNHWEYSWEVSMNFDMEMKTMENSSLRITNLELSDEMDPELSKELKTLMQDGNCIVY